MGTGLFFKENGHNPLLERNLKCHGNGSHRSGIYGNVSFSRELFKLGLLWNHAVTEPSAKQMKKDRFNHEGITKGISDSFRN